MSLRKKDLRDFKTEQKFTLACKFRKWFHYRWNVRLEIQLLCWQSSLLSVKHFMPTMTHCTMVHISAGLWHVVNDKWHGMNWFDLLLSHDSRLATPSSFSRLQTRNKSNALPSSYNAWLLYMFHLDKVVEFLLGRLKWLSLRNILMKVKL